MRHLTVYTRFMMIIVVLSAVFVAVVASQVWVIRTTVIEEREVKVLDLVEAAKKILSHYDEKAKAGKIQPVDAQQLAFDAIGAMRWGAYADYIGVYGAGRDNAGVTYVHANPKYINANRWDYKDSAGRLLIQDIVEKARQGGGYLQYNVPRVAGGNEVPKLSYISGYGAGDKLVAIQAGVYVDDIDEVIFSRAVWIAAGGFGGLLIAAFTAFILGRGLVRRSTGSAVSWTVLRQVTLPWKSHTVIAATRSATFRAAWEFSRMRWSIPSGFARSNPAPN
jgi:methyl-accepting chemotaxis protein